MRLTKIPSAIVIHKRVDTADTRFMEQTQDLVHNPLEKSLGLFDFGRYAQAAPDKEYAFVKINKMWDEPVEDDEEDNDEQNNDGDTPQQEDTDDEDLQLQTEDKHTKAHNKTDTQNTDQSQELKRHTKKLTRQNYAHYISRSKTRRTNYS
jgi:hypothetical protein